MFHADGFSSRVTLNFIFLRTGWSTEVLKKSGREAQLLEPVSTLDVESLDRVPIDWWQYLYTRFHPLLLPPDLLPNIGSILCKQVSAKTLQQFSADTIHRGPGGRGSERLLLFWVTKPKLFFYDPFQYEGTFKGKLGDYKYVENIQLSPAVLARYLYGVNTYAFHATTAMMYDRNPWSYVMQSADLIDELREETAKELRERACEIDFLSSHLSKQKKKKKIQRSNKK